MVRLGAIAPAVLSVISIALGITLITAGSKPGKGGNFFLLSLNTSRVAEGVIRFENVQRNSSSSTTGADPFGIASGLGGLFNNVTGRMNRELQDMESGMVRNVVKSIGLQDSYQLFVRSSCQGLLANQSDPNSIVISRCDSYSDPTTGFENLTRVIPTSINLGVTNVTIPVLITLIQSIDSIHKLLYLFRTMTLVFDGLGIAAAGLVIPLSAAAGLRPTNRAVHVAASVLSLLAAVGFTVGAVAITAFGVLVAYALNNFAKGFNLSGRSGTRAQIVGWAAALLAQAAAGYWLLVWYVEFRRNALVRKRRQDKFIGKYKATLTTEMKRMFVVSGKGKS